MGGVSVKMPTVDAPLMLHGDCLELLLELPDASVDVVVADPPSSIDFMNLSWDRFTNYEPRTRAGRNQLRMLTTIEGMNAAVAALALEVKLANAATRATAARSVERRVANGVAKALKRALKKARAALAVEAGDLAEFAGIAPEHAGFVAFMVDVWTEVDRVLKPGGFVCAWALPKTADLAGLALRAVGWEIHDSLLHLFGGGMKKGIDIGKAIDAEHGAEREVVGEYGRPDGVGRNYAEHALHGQATLGGGKLRADARDITAPATDDARRWDGWHSQLAPGHEQWLLARKPTRLTYARQVLTHCTGALHVDACRIPRGDAAANLRTNLDTKRGTFSGEAYGEASGGVVYEPAPGGSWPRNVLLSCGGEDCPAEALDRQSGATTSVKSPGTPNRQGRAGGIMNPSGKMREQRPEGHVDAGGASRFFTKFDDRAWYGGKAHRRDIPGTSRRISHPTHKNPELMRWLVRLLAATCEQTGGEPAIVLDPFGGSFTTAWACVAERVRCITIERDLDSFEQGRARVLSAIGSPEFAARANAAAAPGAQTALF